MDAFLQAAVGEDARNPKAYGRGLKSAVAVGMFHADPSRMITNVLGTPLASCCTNPMTGFFRDGYCRTGGGDHGLHTVCAKVSDDFLEYSKAAGNDLSTPRPEFGFPGLKDGDQWCLCVTRWAEALDAGKAPPVILEACHLSVLEYVDLEALKAHAVATQ